MFLPFRFFCYILINSHFSCVCIIESMTCRLMFLCTDAYSLREVIMKESVASLY